METAVKRDTSKLTETAQSSTLAVNRVKTKQDWQNAGAENTVKSATNLELAAADFDRLTWLDSEEAAMYLRKTANALRIMVFRGYIRPRKFRRRLYFRKLELDRLLESSNR